MIRINFKNYDEVLALYRFTLNNIEYLPEPNILYVGVIKSLLKEIIRKLRNKTEAFGRRGSINLKLYEALALYTLYMDTIMPRPERTNYEYNIVVMKMNEIHQKTVLKTHKTALNPSQNVTETLQNGF